MILPMKRNACLGLILATALTGAGGCGGGDTPRKGLPDVRLPTLSASAGESLASCATRKCFTVYVAPWCGYCRQATPLIIQLRKFLKGHGVDTRVIVGLDSLESVKEYAAAFGPETLIDMNDSLRVKGVPHFYVSDGTGQVTKELAGFPSGVDDVERLASVFALP